jgi:hypothetical protein
VAAVAALATRNAEFYGGRVFQADAIRRMRASLRPMAWPWLRVHQLAAERGITLLTADQVENPRDVRLIAYDWTPDAERLVAGGARPTVLVSFEPPVIAWSLYARLPELSQQFAHVFLFEGARELVHGTTFHSLRFPQPCPPPRLAPSRWADRRFVVMINSNKALPSVTDPRRWLDRPREVSLKRALAARRYPPIAQDRYLVRFAAIDGFTELDLYGEGWTARHPAVSPDQHARAVERFRGTVGDKLATLAGYRFALAIENTRFPGYISEKLFDCFFAGVIPVYDGAPDVERYVPAEAFVDARQFSGWGAVEQFLRAMSENDCQRMLAAGSDYLRSPEFARFCSDAFARDVVEAL